MKKISEIVHGSHLYGLDTENSDIDYKGIFLPDIKDLVLGTASHEVRSSTGSPHNKNTSNDVDVVYYSLQKFIKMACDGETIAIDYLHCNDENLLESSPVFKELVNNRHKFYTKNMKAFLGYCKKQAAKYGVKGSRLAAMESVLACLKELSKDFDFRLTNPTITRRLKELANQTPEYIKVLDGFEKGGKWIDKKVLQLCESKYDMNCTTNYVYKEIEKKYNSYGHRAQQAKNNEGVDFKAMSHALRAGYQLKEIYETGDLIYPLKDREFLLKVKRGELDFTTEVAPALETVIEEVEILAELSNLPTKVDREFWNIFILRAYNL